MINYLGINEKMNLYKTLIVFFFLYTASAFAELSHQQKELYDAVMKNPGQYYLYDDKEILRSKEKLTEVENKIKQLKEISSSIQDEPRIYYALSELYSVRATMLRRNMVFDGNKELNSFPVVQENLQGIRDNLTEVARLLEEGKGTSIKVWGSMSSVISLDLYERLQKIYLKQNPEGLKCDDPDNQECLPIQYPELALETLTDIAKEYQAYGYFEDADRILNEIESFSAEGKAKVAELRPKYIEVRKTYVRSEEVTDELSYMLPGGTPKPLTIPGIEVIEENHKAAIEKARLRKEAAAKVDVTSSQAESSAPAVPPMELAPTPIEENNNRLILIGAGIVLLLLIGFVALRRRK